MEVVWKSVAYDRMQTALKTFAVDETSVRRLMRAACILPALRSSLSPAKPESNTAASTTSHDVLELSVRTRLPNLIFKPQPNLVPYT